MEQIRQGQGKGGLKAVEESDSRGSDIPEAEDKSLDNLMKIALSKFREDIEGSSDEEDDDEGDEDSGWSEDEE